MRKIVIFATMLILAVSFASTSQAETDEIADLRKEIQKLNQRLDELSSRERQGLDVEYVGRYEGPFKKGGLLIKNPYGFGTISVGGYADIEFENFQNTNSTFDQHRWIINIGAEVGDRLRFFSEYEIEHGGPNAKGGGGEAKVEQAWIDYLINDGINFRVGALLVPFGRYNIYHDSDLQDLTDRPLVARDIIPTTWTESGAGLWGEFNPVIGDYEDLILGYEAYVINGLNASFSDTSLSGAKGSLGTDNNNNKALVGRLVISPALGHELGLSGYWGKYNSTDDSIVGGAIDWLSTWGPLEIVGEAAHFKVDADPTDVVANFFTGYRIQANYHFWPEFLNSTFLGRDFEDPTFTLVARHGWAKIDDDDFDADTINNDEERFTLGLNYRPVESWVLKTEYQWSKTKNESLERGDNNGFIGSIAFGF